MLKNKASRLYLMLEVIGRYHELVRTSQIAYRRKVSIIGTYSYDSLFAYRPLGGKPKKHDFPDSGIEPRIHT